MAAREGAPHSDGSRVVLGGSTASGAWRRGAVQSEGTEDGDGNARWERRCFRFGKRLLGGIRLSRGRAHRRCSVAVRGQNRDSGDRASSARSECRRAGSDSGERGHRGGLGVLARSEKNSSRSAREGRLGRAIEMGQLGRGRASACAQRWHGCSALSR
jgi:hypothetical protein